MREVRIKDICYNSSSNLRQKDLDDIKGDFPVFGASGYIQGINIYHQKNEYIAIVKDGSIGRVMFLPPKSSVIGTMQYILPKDGYNIKYVAYCLQSIDFSKYKQGAVIPHVYFRDYGEHFINVTDDKDEQLRIVSFLDSEFSKIDTLKANAERALQNAKDLFQATLKEVMTPKEGWEEKTIKEIGLTQTGTTPSKSDKSNYGDYMPFIRPSEVNYDGMGGINYNSEIKLSHKGSQTGRVFNANSILMVCIGGTVGKVGLCSQEVSCNQQINVLTPFHNLYNSKYIYYIMSSPNFQDEVLKQGKSAQATLPIINKGKWEKLKITVPDIETQNEIVRRLDGINENIMRQQSNYTRILSECQKLKQALLKQVFE